MGEYTLVLAAPPALMNFNDCDKIARLGLVLK